MNSTVKSYLFFLAFMAVTAVVIRPVVKSLNVPLLDTALGG